MRKCDLVSIQTALILKKIGYREKTTAYKYIRNSNIHRGLEINWNSVSMYLSMPTQDEVIDWLRRKYNVIVAHRILPFVDPTTKQIVYQYAVKYCNTRDGWNGRVYIGETACTKNIYSAKKTAINMALRWIIKNLSVSR